MTPSAKHEHAIFVPSNQDKGPMYQLEASFLTELEAHLTPPAPHSQARVNPFPLPGQPATWMPAPWKRWE